MYCTPSRSKSLDEKGKCGADNTSCERTEESQDTWHLLPNVDTSVGHWEYDMSHIPFAMTLDDPAFIRQPEAHECHWVQPEPVHRSLWPPDHTCQTSDEFWGNYCTSPPLPPSPTPDTCIECGNT